MKPKIVFAVCATMLVASLGIASAADVKFSMERKRLSQEKPQTSSTARSSTASYTDVNTRVDSKDIIYTIIVESTSLRLLENVTVEYNIYYEQPQIGSMDRPPVKTLAGKHTIEKLPSYKKVPFDTDSITMKETHIEEQRTERNPTTGRSTGASSNTSNQIKDRIVGNVIRAYNAEGKLIGEYINPASADTKFEWKKP